MDTTKKKGLMSAMKCELVRSLTPSRLRSMSFSTSNGEPMSSLLRRRLSSVRIPSQRDERPMSRSERLRPTGEALEPLREGPDPDCGETEGLKLKRSGSGLGNWMRGHMMSSSSTSKAASSYADVRLLLGVMGAPLAPVHVSVEDNAVPLRIKESPIDTLSAQYILQQYIAASGGRPLLNSVGNSYATGKVKMMASTCETATRVLKDSNGSRDTQSGGFVLWQMNPGMWYVELAVGDSKVHAGCDGMVVWRHTPWLGAHSAKGPIRPLRRALQGLDPWTTACVFANSKCVGEKIINGEDCFILKLCANSETLKARNDGPAEIIRHTMLGYFSQKRGLLIQLEDSHLTRIQTIGEDAVYWETSINTFIDDYRPVDGVMIAHAGRSYASLLKFSEITTSSTKTIMEEGWTIDEVAYNVPGLSEDCFIPPSDLKSRSLSES